MAASSFGEQHSLNHHQKATLGGVLITLGIVFGDIGTSPLYTVNAIAGEDPIDSEIIFGAFSCIFWTLTVQTTLKYVLITLRADNNGEGGIFSLYTLVRRLRGWLMFPAIIGGAFLMADGLLTPPVSVSSAVEGLRRIYPEINTVPIVLGIIFLLFAVQQFGTASIGWFFGPIMMAWFLFIGGIGAYSALNHPEIFNALNPVYAYNLLVVHPGGFWLLGAVFLCTTGAEALYSDLGHCGRENIRISWLFVKATLLLSYAGQCAWLIGHEGQIIHDTRTFYAIVPEPLVPFSIVLATAAAIIASQALISGCFTLVSEAMRLDLWPKFKMIYPTNLKGQIYVPLMNWFMMLGCMGVVLYFEESTAMEAAYGLSVTITMLMTTVLLSYYLLLHRTQWVVIAVVLGLFIAVETSFLIANLTKLFEGGWISLLIGLVLFGVMWVWHRGYVIKKQLMEYVPLIDFLPKLKELSIDESVGKTSTHLVYLTGSHNPAKIEKRIMYSIFQRSPKRADLYWFIHVNVTNRPYDASYEVEFIDRDDVIWVTFNLGFRVEPRINLFFRQVVQELVKNGEINLNSRYSSLGRNNMAGDFRFVLMETFLSYDNSFSKLDNLIMKTYFSLRHLSLSDQASFGLDTSNVTIEKVPLVVSPFNDIKLTRKFPDNIMEC